MTLAPSRARSSLRTLAALAAVAVALVGPGRAEAAASRAAAERDFLRTTRPSETANQITSDVPYYVGRHVRLICTVDAIVSGTTLIGQCGKDVEPVDIYVKMATARREVGERFQLLGVVETPAVWIDALGHQVYYPIVRAVFTDPTTLPQ